MVPYSTPHFIGSAHYSILSRVGDGADAADPVQKPLRLMVYLATPS